MYLLEYGVPGCLPERVCLVRYTLGVLGYFPGYLLEYDGVPGYLTERVCFGGYILWGYPATFLGS